MRETDVRDALVRVRDAMKEREVRALLGEFVRLCPDAVVRYIAMCELAKAIEARAGVLGVPSRYPATYLAAWARHRDRTRRDIERAFTRALKREAAHAA